LYYSVYDKIIKALPTVCKPLALWDNTNLGLGNCN